MTASPALLTKEHLAAITRRVHLSHERGDDAGPIAVDRRLLLQHIAALEQRADKWKVAHDEIAAGASIRTAEIRYLQQRLSEQETLLAERNRQNAAAFGDRDALLADQHRLLYLASTASMNWGHRDRAGYTLDPLQFESARDVIRPDDFRRAIDAAMAGPCADIRAAKVHP